MSKFSRPLELIPAVLFVMAVFLGSIGSACYLFAAGHPWLGSIALIPAVVIFCQLWQAWRKSRERGD